MLPNPTKDSCISISALMKQEITEIVKEMNDEMEITLEDVLSRLENDAQILQYRLGKEELLVWPFLRHSILIQLVYFNQGILWTPDVRPLSILEKIRNVFHAIVHSPFRLIFGRKKILYFNSGTGNYLIDGVFHNRLVDDFYFAFPKESALIESLRNGRVAFPRSHGDTYTHLGFKVATKIMTPFYSFKNDKKTLESFYNFLRVRLNDLPIKESTWQSISSVLRQKFDYLQVEYGMFSWFFKKVKPKLIIVEDAFHGYFGHIVKAANNLNIPVAEFQHGTINSKHLAYNYGHALNTSSEYADYNPGIFLSYGPFWTKGIKNAAEKISIGNPFISKQLRNNADTLNKTVLVLSAAVSEEKIRSLVKKLLQLGSLKDFTISLRLHPLEKNLAGKYESLISNRFQLDSEPTIFESLAKSKIVFSEYSTAAFDALMFGKPVLLYKTEMVKMATAAELEHFRCFSLEELTDEFVVTSMQADNQNRNDVCDSNWEANFKNFINKHLNS